uniref:Tr-type G domain-containing protein n=1 Tax=Chromera velia CCMP2878 TaxID=1169474 RepID=A0A0G4FVU6_9ALVE|eukprot:Cvel_3807.t1-p1 / transcript=Cvel_3807.t1 / gene=Cvel_3807 / organism=Chromera_velia_CCMP2878 / gene_product=Translation initiation factor IF-2, putative / transcript_product=Translation initiation factor IF-2, putative / location=Cvel_scaffold160:76658-87183(-) / protein_length=1223 / sequence_SO=supercontig / SO=protein_coding / is_pseudo=false
MVSSRSAPPQSRTLTHTFKPATQRLSEVPDTFLPIPHSAAAQGTGTNPVWPAPRTLLPIEALLSSHPPSVSLTASPEGSLIEKGGGPVQRVWRRRFVRARKASLSRRLRLGSRREEGGGAERLFAPKHLNTVLRFRRFLQRQSSSESEGEDVGASMKEQGGSMKGMKEQGGEETKTAQGKRSSAEPETKKHRRGSKGRSREEDEEKGEEEERKKEERRRRTLASLVNLRAIHKGEKGAFGVTQNVASLHRRFRKSLSKIAYLFFSTFNVPNSLVSPVLYEQIRNELVRSEKRQNCLKVLNFTPAESLLEEHRESLKWACKFMPRTLDSEMRSAVLGFLLVHRLLPIDRNSTTDAEAYHPLPGRLPPLCPYFEGWTKELDSRVRLFLLFALGGLRDEQAQYITWNRCISRLLCVLETYGDRREELVRLAQLMQEEDPSIQELLEKRRRRRKTTAAVEDFGDWLGDDIILQRSVLNRQQTQVDSGASLTLRGRGGTSRVPPSFLDPERTSVTSLADHLMNSPNGPPPEGLVADDVRALAAALLDVSEADREAAGALQEQQRGRRRSSERLLSVEEAEFVAEELGVSDLLCFGVRNIEGKLTAREMRDRPPVVAVMGHVDHGKTTLLDSLRESSIAAGEAGGITQKMSAFEVIAPNSKERMTFLDTPGHKVFSDMRKRGASLTDIAVLVVAADDGVMPQTVEALDFARSAGVPVVVAINKIDREAADVETVMKELKSHDLVAEQLGGDVQTVPVSAKQNKNLESLEEAIILQASTLNLKGDVAGCPELTVLDVNRGLGSQVSVSALVRSGVLMKGQWLVSGKDYDRAAVMRDMNGKEVNEVLPGSAVLLQDVPGLSGLSAGSRLVAARDRSEASRRAERERTAQTMARMDQEDMAATVDRQRAVFLEKLKGKDRAHLRPQLRKLISEYAGDAEEAEEDAEGIESRAAERDGDDVPSLGEEGEPREGTSITDRVGALGEGVGLVVKADSAASLESLMAWLSQFNEEQRVKLGRPVSAPPLRVLLSGVGPPTRDEVALGTGALDEKEKERVGGGRGEKDSGRDSGPPVVFFSYGLQPSDSIVASIEEAGGIHRGHAVIYKIFDDMEELCDHTYGPPFILKQKGRMTVSAVMTFDFKTRKGGTRVVAGCVVKDGVATNKLLYRVMRGGQDVSGLLELQSMALGRDLISEAKKGDKAGFIFKNFDDLEENDEVVFFEKTPRPPLFASSQN